MTIMEEKMAADIYARIRANPKFEGFVGMRNRYSAIMAILGAIAYYGFILLVAYDKEFLAKKIGEGWTTSLGIPLGVGVIVFNPLAGGLLTGKHRPGSEPEAGGRFGPRLGATAEIYRRRYWREEALQAVAGLKAFFDARGRSVTTAAVAWVLEQEGITSAIVGASRAEQLESTLAAVDFRLDDEERAALESLWYALPRQRPEPGPVR